jgi:hypothetical protein
VALTSWKEALGMILGANHRKVGGIRYKIEINTEAIGRVRGAFVAGQRGWLGGRPRDISIVDVEIDGEVPSQ